MQGFVALNNQQKGKAEQTIPLTEVQIPNRITLRISNLPRNQRNLHAKTRTFQRLDGQSKALVSLLDITIPSCIG